VWERRGKKVKVGGSEGKEEREGESKERGRDRERNKMKREIVCVYGRVKREKFKR
jgi:hypothetical protein